MPLPSWGPFAMADKLQDGRSLTGEGCWGPMCSSNGVRRREPINNSRAKQCGEKVVLCSQQLPIIGGAQGAPSPPAGNHVTASSGLWGTPSTYYLGYFKVWHQPCRAKCRDIWELFTSDFLVWKLYWFQWRTQESCSLYYRVKDFRHCWREFSSYLKHFLENNKASKHIFSFNNKYNSWLWNEMDFNICEGNNFYSTCSGAPHQCIFRTVLYMIGAYSLS